MDIKILNLLFEYSNSGRLVDGRFIENFVSIILDKEKLNNYVKDIAFEPFNSQEKNSIAGYNYARKKIVIFYERLDSYINGKRVNDAYIPEKEKIFYKNIEICQMLLHELEHANQSKIIDQDNTLESDILKLIGVGKSREIIETRLKNSGISNNIINIILDNKDKVYYKYYDFAPHERLAEIKSHESIVEIISPIKNFIPCIYNLENVLILKSKMKGYTLNKELISPTIYYLKNQGEENNLNKFLWYDKDEHKCLLLSKKLYKKERRIKLGLPIDRFEHFNLNCNLEKAVRRL